MTERDMYVLAEEALAGVIDRIRNGQWEMRTPSWFAKSGQGDATLRQIVNYHAYDTAWVPDVLAGKTAAEVGDTFEHLKTDAHVDYRVYSDRAVAAARAFDDPERPVHLSYGDFPAREYFEHITSFRGFRAYDIARWIGASTMLPIQLVEAMVEHLGPDMESWRKIGVYGPAVMVPEDAPLQDRLLGLSGRDPNAR